MAKASIVTKTGAAVTVEGTAEEVALLIERLDGGNVQASPPKVKKPAARRGVKNQQRRARSGPASLLLELVESGFFKHPTGLGDIKKELEKRGHYYPLTTLSPAALRLVKSRVLRRIKQGNTWTYVG